MGNDSHVRQTKQSCGWNQERSGESTFACAVCMNTGDLIVYPNTGSSWPSLCLTAVSVGKIILYVNTHTYMYIFIFIYLYIYKYICRCECEEIKEMENTGHPYTLTPQKKRHKGTEYNSTKA